MVLRNSNQDRICLVKILEYVGFCCMMGPDYYAPLPVVSRLVVLVSLLRRANVGAALFGRNMSLGLNRAP